MAETIYLIGNIVGLLIGVSILVVLLLAAVNLYKQSKLLKDEALYFSEGSEDTENPKPKTDETNH